MYKNQEENGIHELLKLEKLVFIRWMCYYYDNRYISYIIYLRGKQMNSKSDYAYREIKNKIIQGELAPLSDIVEERFQEELNISRTPIREAVQRLNKEGFVYIYARKGTIVSPINVEMIYSVYQARLLNEPYLSKKFVMKCRKNGFVR